MQKKFNVSLIFLLMFFLVSCADSKVETIVPKSQSNFSLVTKYGDYQSQEQELSTFIEQKMLTKKGIYTNYKKQTYRKDEARGHELLSESSGFWLEYLVTTHQYKKFRQFYAATKTTFDQGSQFSYRYVTATKKQFNVNATLDDLRIIRALQMYSEATGNRSYKKEAATRFAKLQKNTMSRGKIASFYDVKAHQASAESALAYYDFSTLKYFEMTSKKNQKMYAQQKAAVKHGFLGDAFPLYAASYNWQSKTYSNQNLNTSEALETILHLSEIGEAKKVTVNWLKRQVNNKTLYNIYSVNGNVIDKNQSAGSYAVAAMIFATEKDPTMYRKAMNLVWKYQVGDESSPIYGGIGIKRQQLAYSYNNLTALLAAKY